MDSVETHYAAYRDKDSPHPSPVLKIPKRPMDTGTLESRPKRHCSGERSSMQSTGEENLSPQGRDIQNLMRQELQRRLQKKLGIGADREDSIEVESSRLPGKTGLESGSKLTMGKRLPKKSANGKVIPVKTGGTSLGLGTGSTDEISIERSRDLATAIKPPLLSADEPSIKLIPEKQVSLPKDKKVPTKHAPQPAVTGSRALVIP